MCRKYILIIFMIFICILLLNISEVRGTTDLTTETIPEQVKSFLESTEYFNNPNYDFLCYRYLDSNSNATGIVHVCLFINKSDTLKFYVSNGIIGDRTVNLFVANELFNGHIYGFDGNFELFADNAVTNADWLESSIYKGFAELDSYYYSSVDLYTDNSYTSIFYSKVDKFLSPYLINVNDIENNPYFEYIYIASNGLEDLVEYIDIRIQEDYYPIEDVNVNYGKSVIYRIYTNTLNFEYIEGKKVFWLSREQLSDNFDFEAGKSYNYNFIYLYEQSEIITDTEVLNINKTEEQQSQEQLQDNVSDINDFLKDDTFNKDTITNNMPNSDSYNDPTSNSFDNFFNTLKNSFTSQNYKDIVLPIPFTKGKEIIIPTNLTENIIPDLLKNLIRMVYWFILSRYIVKDIASYIEKAKSGDIFSHTDTNIKTDML